MKGLRTFLVLLAIVLSVAFAVANWDPVAVRIWPRLIWETKLPALVIGAFLAGLLPMWLIHRATRWRLARRIANLESSLASHLAHSSREPAFTPAETE